MVTTTGGAVRGTLTRRDGLVVVSILIVAAVTRLVGLPSRGEWDDDQGNEMIAMLFWVRDGQVPVLGPLSSIGTAHHGAGIYWVLAPSAFLTDAHPVAGILTVALIGIGGVAATWWLGWTVGGRVAGHVAGLLMAVNPSSISASTFVWNAHIVGPAAALAVAAAWHAWRTRRARWGLAAGAGTMLMLQGHLLAVLATAPLAALLIADLRRRPRADRASMRGPVLGAAAIVAAGFVPTILHELRGGFGETRAVAAYLSDAGSPADPPLVVRPVVIAWRVLAGPLSGPVSSAVLVAVPAAIITAAALVVAARGRAGVSREFGRWAVGTTIWAVLALSLCAPALAVFTASLPNDQYHAWLDPVLCAAVGIAVTRVARDVGARAGRIAACAIIVACLALSLASTPQLMSPSGGWPRAVQTAARIHALTLGRPTAVAGVAKSGGAVAFPLLRQRAVIVPAAAARFLVVTCDPRFEVAIGLRCGGEAEAAVARGVGFAPAHLVDRFADSRQRVICVFERD